MHGANRKKNRSVKTTLRKALHFASRTAFSWIIFLAAITLPVVAAAIMTITYILFFVDTQLEALAVLPYGIIAAASGVLVMLLFYSLVPIVALFEPKLTYKEVFTTSKRLMARKGKMFVLAAYGTLAATLTAAYGLSLLVQNLFGIDKTLLFCLMLLVASAYFNGIMTTFYRKRRLARSR